MIFFLGGGMMPLGSNLEPHGGEMGSQVYMELKKDLLQSLGSFGAS